MTSIETLGGFGLLLVRPGMLVLATPFFGAASAPAAIRVGLTLVVALLLAPVVTMPAPLSLAALTPALLREVAIGLSLAMAIRILVFGAEFAGQFAGYSIGLSVGSLIDPQSGVRNNTLAVLYANIVVLVAFSLNAHHRLIEALAQSYSALPIGIGSIDASLGGQVATMLGLVFVIGVRLAAPVVMVLVIVELALGLAGKVAPSLNVMISGAPIRLVVGLLVLAAALITVPPIVNHYLPVTLDLANATARSFE